MAMFSPMRFSPTPETRCFKYGWVFRMGRTLRGRSAGGVGTETLQGAGRGWFYTSVRIFLVGCS